MHLIAVYSRYKVRVRKVKEREREELARSNARFVLVHASTATYRNSQRLSDGHLIEGFPTFHHGEREKPTTSLVHSRSFTISLYFLFLPATFLLCTIYFFSPLFPIFFSTFFCRVGVCLFWASRTVHSRFSRSIGATLFSTFCFSERFTSLWTSNSFCSGIRRIYTWKILPEKIFQSARSQQRVSYSNFSIHAFRQIWSNEFFTIIQLCLEMFCSPTV